MSKRITFQIAGQAGFGIKEAGIIMSRTLLNQGYFVFDYSEYPSLVRGGHNTYQATASTQPLDSFYKTIDILVALDQTTIDQDLHKLSSSGVVICDPTVCQTPEDMAERTISVPLQEITKHIQAPEIVKNTVALGATQAVLNLSLSYLLASLNRSFEAKGESILKINHQAAQEGFNFVKEKYPNAKLELEKAPSPTNQILLTANDAMSLATISAGAQAYFAYPMTPASSILHSLAKIGEKGGIIVRQSEDEIAVINNTIGASFSGIRCACGTSGGGFALMVEALGLAAITETPLVIYEVQRPGPATGVPTWTGQGDLDFVRHAAPGDFLRVVVAPGDIKEAYEMTIQAFNLAERYQIPVIVLTDKLLAESRQTVAVFDSSAVKIDHGELLDSFDENYQRYLKTDSGISPRAIPGKGEGVVRANSDEHDETGFSTEDAEVISDMVEKRARKIKLLREELPPPQVFGPKEADLTLVSWGSTKLAINQALKELEGKSVNHIHFTYVSPLPQQTEELLKRAKRLVMVEGNQSGQLTKLIREETGILIEDKILKYDGRPFYPEEIKEEVDKRIGK